MTTRKSSSFEVFESCVIIRKPRSTLYSHWLSVNLPNLMLSVLSLVDAKPNTGRICQANRCCSCEEQGQWWESVNQTADFLKTLTDVTLLMWLCWLRILINHGESLVLTNKGVAEACVVEAYKKICLGYGEEEEEAEPIWSFAICISFNIALYSVETDHYHFLTKL